jgi:N-acyl homoserine lactone hydrolase
MNAPAPITITPVRVADLLAEGERMPAYVHVIDHPDARVLVDTGMTELHPAVADLRCTRELGRPARPRDPGEICGP